mmetsp:Transcript_7628/g.22533  ORF Transcript_7628/g.22533 Transcript_7628/m.22533 type:complete len:1268 (+) Transcript_7628:318-4121(+)
MGSSEEQGEIAFFFCVAIFLVTFCGFAYTYYHQRKKANRIRAAAKAREEKKASGPGFNVAKVRGQNDPAAIKARVCAVWKISRDAEHFALKGRGGLAPGMHAGMAYVPDEESSTGKFVRAITLLRAEVLSVHEAYVELLRDITPPEHAIPGASTRATDLVQSLAPFVGQLEGLGDQIKSYQAKHHAGSDDKILHKLASALRDEAEKLSRAWLQISKAMPRLKVPSDGRFDVGWDLKGTKCGCLEHLLTEHLSFVDKRAAGILPESNGPAELTFADKFWAHFPTQVRRHPIFYAVVAALYIAVMIPFLMGINQPTWRGMFGTFLPVPPQYCIDCLPGGEGVEIQRALVPIVYAIMHTAMLSLCLLPIPLCRGLLRDFTNAGANARGVFPIEDAVWIHKLFGVLMLLGLFIAPFFWLIAMGSSCMGTATDNDLAIAKACSAFNPFVVDAKAGPIPPANNVSQHVIMPDLIFDSFEGASFFDARDNVLFLRAVAWPLFFGVTPWIIRRGDMTFPKWFPAFVVRYWFEIATYSHYFVAWAAIALAVYARFEVFFVAIIGFGLLLIEKIREWTLHSFTVPIRFGANATRDTFTLLHRSSQDERPTAIELVIKRPSGFTFHAGQYLFIKVPSVDSVWHAFSLGSCPADDAIHLHIGVIGGQKDNWIKPTDSDPEFRQKNPTWTYKLFAKVRDTVIQAQGRKDYEPIKAVVRGPYGSPFQSCFTSNYKAAVLVGSGTGLTSALSVLKEVMERRRLGQPTADKVWFVWTCRNVRDLRWCWRTLQQAVVDAVQSGAIQVPDGWSAATSSSLDWLGISIFVSQANKSDLLGFLGYSDESQEGAFVDEDDFDYHETDMLPTGPPGTTGDKNALPPKPGSTNEDDALPTPPGRPGAAAAAPARPPRTATNDVVFFDKDRGAAELPPIPPRGGAVHSQVPKKSFDAFLEGDDDENGEDDYIPPPIPAKAQHGAASEVVALQAEVELVKKAKERRVTLANGEQFWGEAGTVDFSTTMYSNQDDIGGATRYHDTAAKDQLNKRFEAGFKLKMPVLGQRRRAPPVPPAASPVQRRSSRWRRKDKPPAPPPVPAYDDDDDDDDVDEYYVVSTSVLPASGGKRAPAAITMDDIYVSSQQRDVLHTCDADIKSALKRVATRKAGKAVGGGGNSEIDKLVESFLDEKNANKMSEEELLAVLLERSQGRQRLDLGAFLKEQVIASSMDTKGAHIRDLLQDLTLMPDYGREAQNRGVSVCFCGPNGLAQSLSKISREMNITFEYLAHAN